MGRYLGQHFLIHSGIVHRILKALQLPPAAPVLEIGPGRGALTLPLARQAGKLLLVERDPLLAQYIQDRLGERGELTVWNQDFLETPWQEIVALLGENFFVVSNLPYEAATPILLKLLHHLPGGSSMVLMFQKEVAQRLVAVPHSKAFGSLTVWTQVFAEVRTVLEVPAAAFRPPPRVESQVVAFRLHDLPKVPLQDQARFEALLREGFSHRRKMLRQNLKGFFKTTSSEEIEERLKRVGALPTARAEELALSQWVSLMAGE